MAIESLKRPRGDHSAIPVSAIMTIQKTSIKASIKASILTISHSLRTLIFSFLDNPIVLSRTCKEIKATLCSSSFWHTVGLRDFEENTPAPFKLRTMSAASKRAAFAVLSCEAVAKMQKAAFSICHFCPLGTQVPVKLFKGDLFCPTSSDRLFCLTNPTLTRPRASPIFDLTQDVFGYVSSDELVIQTPDGSFPISIPSFFPSQINFLRVFNAKGALTVHTFELLPFIREFHVVIYDLEKSSSSVPTRLSFRPTKATCCYHEKLFYLAGKREENDKSEMTVFDINSRFIYSMDIPFHPCITSLNVTSKKDKNLIFMGFENASEIIYFAIDKTNLDKGWYSTIKLETETDLPYSIYSIQIQGNMLVALAHISHQTKDEADLPETELNKLNSLILFVDLRTNKVIKTYPLIGPLGANENNFQIEIVGSIVYVTYDMEVHNISWPQFPGNFRVVSKFDLTPHIVQSETGALSFPPPNTTLA
jgi:hypothetical protein